MSIESNRATATPRAVETSGPTVMDDYAAARAALTWDLVCGLSPRLPDLYAALLGTLRARSVFSPLFSAFGPEPIRRRMALGHARLLETTPTTHRKKVTALRESLPELEHVLLIGPGSDDLVGSEPLGPGVHALAELSPATTGRFEAERTDPEEPALVHLTSGTTGAPKGAVHVRDVEAAAAPATLASPAPHQFSSADTRVRAPRPSAPAPTGCCPQRCCSRRRPGACARWPSSTASGPTRASSRASRSTSASPCRCAAGGLVVADLREAHTKTVDGLMVALVGFGRVVERPWAGNGMLTFRPVVVATLAADHRVSDGHRGSRLPVALDADLREAVDLDSLDVLADYLLTRTDGG